MSIIKKISHFFFGETCMSCKKKGVLNSYGFCAGCSSKCVFIDNFFQPAERYHVFRYEGEIKRIITDFKYRRKRFYGKKLAKTAASFLKEKGIEDFECIIPVPLHWKKEFKRGFNQSSIISVCLGRMTGRKVLLNVLLKTRNTRSQTMLKGSERKENARKSFSVRNGKLVRGSDILLVDDVYTTGATVAEARKALMEAGARKVLILTIAKA